MVAFCFSLRRLCGDVQRCIVVKIDEMRYCAFPVERHWVSHAERKPIYLSGSCVSQQATVASMFGQNPAASKEKGWRLRNQEKRKETKHFFCPQQQMHCWCCGNSLCLQMALLTLCAKAWSVNAQIVTRALRLTQEYLSLSQTMPAKIKAMYQLPNSHQLSCRWMHIRGTVLCERQPEV